MPLDYNELEPIISAITEKIKAEIIQANRIDMLDEVLEKYNVGSMFVTSKIRRPGDTILVLGNRSISKVDLENLFRRYKLDYRNFEFVEYDECTNYNYTKLIGNNKYTDVFVGPVPHSGKNIGNFSGILEYLKENHDIPANILELTDSNGEQKITKRTFKDALDSCVLLNDRD